MGSNIPDPTPLFSAGTGSLTPIPGQRQGPDTERRGPERAHILNRALACRILALSPYCPIALLPYCPIALLPYCLIALLPDCPTHLQFGHRP